jgi:hypothetical protein
MIFCACASPFAVLATSASFPMFPSRIQHFLTSPEFPRPLSILLKQAKLLPGDWIETSCSNSSRFSTATGQPQNEPETE